MYYCLFQTELVDDTNEYFTVAASDFYACLKQKV